MLSALVVASLGLAACGQPPTVDNPTIAPSGAPTGAPTSAPTIAPTQAPPTAPTAVPRYRDAYYFGDYGDTSDNPNTSPSYLAESLNCPINSQCYPVAYMTVSGDPAVAYRLGSGSMTSGTQVVWSKVNAIGAHDASATCYVTTADRKATLRVYTASGQNPADRFCQAVWIDNGIWG